VKEIACARPRSWPGDLWHVGNDARALLQRLNSKGDIDDRHFSDVRHPMRRRPSFGLSSVWADIRWMRSDRRGRGHVFGESQARNMDQLGRDAFVRWVS
jgi:hypothetical protein